MINQGLEEAVAISRHSDNERTIAAVELRRQAKAAGRAEGSPARVVAVQLPSLGFMVGAWRRRGRGLAGVVVRRALA